MTLSPQNPNRRGQNQTSRSTGPSKSLPPSHECLRDANVSQLGLTQAEADAFIEALPAIQSEKDLRWKLCLSVSEIGLSELATNTLLKHGVFTVEHLLNCHEAQLRAMPRIGDAIISDIFACMSRLGFRRGS